MHEPAGSALLVWPETTALAAAMREWLWLYPIVEIVHIAGFMLLVGTVALFDLRVLGAARGPAINALAHFTLPWAWVGLAVAVPSGLLMFAAHATEMIDNPAFRLKLALLAAAGLNAWLFHRGVFRTVEAWACAAALLRACFAAATSLGLWLEVIACGRLIAYS